MDKDEAIKHVVDYVADCLGYQSSQNYAYAKITADAMTMLDTVAWVVVSDIDPHGDPRHWTRRKD